MADDKSGRERQARNAEKRQQQREILEALERREEAEPPVDRETLDDIEVKLDTVEFPATGAEIVETVGEKEIDSAEGQYRVADLIPETEEEVFDEPETVRLRVERPTVAASMKRVLEAVGPHPRLDLQNSQREAYEKTFRSLKNLDADDDDEGIREITNWIIEQIEQKEKLPGSRGVRRQAAKFCREKGYEIRNDEWLGI